MNSFWLKKTDAIPDFVEYIKEADIKPLGKVKITDEGIEYTEYSKDGDPKKNKTYLEVAEGTPVEPYNEELCDFHRDVVDILGDILTLDSWEKEKYSPVFNVYHEETGSKIFLQFNNYSIMFPLMLQMVILVDDETQRTIPNGVISWFDPFTQEPHLIHDVIDSEGEGEDNESYKHLQKELKKALEAYYKLYEVLEAGKEIIND